MKNKNKFFEDKMSQSNNAESSYSSSLSDEEAKGSNAKHSRITSLNATFDSEICNNLRRKADKALQIGKIPDALDKYENTLKFIAKLYGVQSGDFLIYYTQLIEALNARAMQYLKLEQSETSYEILVWCEKITQSAKFGDFPMLRNLTLNNLACLYRRMGKLQLALNYLNEALYYLQLTNALVDSATTYLNLCAVLSQMGNHHEALNHAKNALIHAQDQLLKFQESKVAPEKIKEKVTVLAISYYNMGVEEEFIRKYESALEWYEKSIKVLEEYDLKNPKLEEKFKRAYDTAKLKYANMLAKKPKAPSSDAKLPLSHVRRDSESYKSLHRKTLLSPQNRVKQLSIGAPKIYNSSKSQFVFQNNRIVDLSTQNQSIQSPLEEELAIRKSATQPNFSKKTFAPKITAGNLSATAITHNHIHKSISLRDKALVDNYMQNQASTPSKQQKTQKLRKVRPNKSHLHVSVNETKGGDQDWEIKTLSKAGVLSWSDSDDKLGSDGQETEVEIKNNRIKFLETLNSSNSSKMMKVVSSNNLNFDLLDDNGKVQKKSENSLTQTETVIEERTNTKHSSREFDKKHERQSERLSSRSDKHSQSQHAAKTEILVTHKTDSSVSHKRDLSHHHNEDSLLGQEDHTSSKELKHLLKQRPTKQEQENAAIKIQAFYKGRVARENYEILKLHEQKYKERIILFRGHIPLRVLIDSSSEKQSWENYDVMIIFSVNSKELQFYASSVIQSKLLTTSYSLENELTFDIKAEKKSSLRALLENKYQRLIPKLYVDQHRLCIDSKHWQEQKESPTHKDPSSNANLQGFGMTSTSQQNDSNLRRTTSPDDSDPEVAKVKGAKPTIINMSQQNKAVVKIQACIRRYLERKKLLLRKSQKILVVFRKIFKQEDAFIDAKIIKTLTDNPSRNLIKDDVLITAYNISAGFNFRNLKLSPALLSQLGNNWENVLAAVDFCLDKKKIRLRPKYKSSLSPQKPASASSEPKINEKMVIKIQRNIRRYLCRQKYLLLLARKRRDNGLHMINAWFKLLDHMQFKLAVYYNPSEGRFSVVASTKDRPYAIAPVTIPVFSLSLDRRDIFNSVIQNVADKIRANTTLKPSMNEYKLEVDVVKVALQIQTIDLEDEAPSSIKKRRELAKMRAKIREQNYAKKFIDNGYHVKEVVDPKSLVKNLGESHQALLEKELKSVKSVQRFYRRHRVKRRFNVRLSIGKSADYRTSQSLYLLHNLHSKTPVHAKDSSPIVSKFPSFRSQATEKNRRNSSKDVKAAAGENAPQHLYTGTKRFDQSRNAKIDVFIIPAQESSKETLLCDISFEITGTTQHLKISVTEISPEFDQKKFVKQIKPLLFDRLEYVRSSHKVIFNSNPVKAKAGDETVEKNKQQSQDHPASHEKAISIIQKLIRARNARKQYEILRASSAKNTKHLARYFQKIDGQFVVVNYALLQAECLISAEASLVENHCVQSKVYVPLKDIVENINEFFKALISANFLEVKQKAVPAIEKLKNILQIKAASESVIINTAKDQIVHVISNLDEALKFTKDQQNELLTLRIGSYNDLNSGKLKNWKRSGSQDDSSMHHGESKISKDALWATTIDKKPAKGTKKPTQKESEVAEISSTKKIEGHQSEAEESKQLTQQHNMFQIEADVGGLQSTSPVQSRPKNKEIPVKKISDPKEFEHAALTIQKRLKGFMTRELYKLRGLKRINSGKSKFKKYITLKRLRKIDNEFWEITAMRADEAPENIYFIAREIDGARRCEGTYKYEKATLINTKNRKIEDYLIDFMKIKDQQLTFDTETSHSNFTKLTEFNLNPLDTSRSRDPVGSDTHREKEAQDEGIVLNQVSTQQAGNNMSLYSVVYNQEELSEIKKPKHFTFKRDKRENIMMAENPLSNARSNSKKDTIVGLTPNTHAEPEKNTVKVEIDAEELRRLVPDLNLNSPSDLKKISSQLAASIKVNPSGELVIDSTKLDPAAVRLQHKNIAISEKPLEMAKADSYQAASDPIKRKAEVKKTVLQKSSKSFAGKKHLIIINSIEKPSAFNNTTIESQNKIVEEYDLHIQVSAVEVDGMRKAAPIVWDIPLSEAALLTEQEDLQQIASFLMKKIQVFGDRFFISVSKKFHYETKAAVAIHERVLRIIQNNFRSRNFISSYRKYKKAIKTFKPKLIYKTGIAIKESNYIVAFVEDTADLIQIHAWNTENFQEFTTEMSSEKLKQVSEFSRKATLETIATNLKLKKNEKGILKLSI